VYIQIEWGCSDAGVTTPRREPPLPPRTPPTTTKLILSLDFYISHILLHRCLTSLVSLLYNLAYTSSRFSICINFTLRASVAFGEPKGILKMPGIMKTTASYVRTSVGTYTIHCGSSDHPIPMRVSSEL
jgi:hypothetical protein